jgi:hypothetical protein
MCSGSATRSDPGPRVEVVANEDGAHVRRVVHDDDRAELVARLRDRADGGLSADEVLELTRGDMA